MEDLREQLLCDQRHLVYRQLVATKFLNLTERKEKILLLCQKADNNLRISADGSG